MLPTLRNDFQERFKLLRTARRILRSRWCKDVTKKVAKERLKLTPSGCYPVAQRILYEDSRCAAQNLSAGSPGSPRALSPRLRGQSLRQASSICPNLCAMQWTLKRSIPIVRHFSKNCSRNKSTSLNSRVKWRDHQNPTLLLNSTSKSKQCSCIKLCLCWKRMLVRVKSWAQRAERKGHGHSLLGLPNGGHANTATTCL